MALLPWRTIAESVIGRMDAPTRTETLSLAGASGRVLASDMHAMRPLPSFDHAVMDGYALGSPPPGRYRLLPSGAESLAAGEASPASTGERIPRGTATVVLATRAEVEGDGLLVPTAAFKDNIRRAGEEAAIGDIVMRAGLRLDARHLALASAAGFDRLPVMSTPRVALVGVANGSEALPHLAVMAALLDTRSLRLTPAGAVRPQGLRSELTRLAPAHDLIIIVGESLGDESGLLAGCLLEAGGAAELLRAAMKPAKPILSGRLGDAAIIGLSGTAYAVTAAAHLVLRPALRAAAGLPQDDPLLPAVSGFTRERSPGRAEALPSRMHRRGGALVLAEAGRFGQLSALSALDGFALIEAETGAVKPGDPLLFHPLLMPLL